MKKLLIKILSLTVVVTSMLFVGTACKGLLKPEIDLEPEHVCEYTKTVVPPTCTEQGYTLYQCECNKSYQDEHVAALGHSFTNYTSNNNATCTEDGTKTAVCDRNGCNVVDTIADPDTALGHSFTNYTSNNDATIEADGTKTATCDRDGCIEMDTITDEGSKLVHNDNGGGDFDIEDPDWMD